MTELAPPNLLLVGNLDQPAFQGHEAEKEISLYCVMEQNASDCHFVSFCRSFAAAVDAGGPKRSCDDRT
jgi:hypothetical protein